MMNGEGIGGKESWRVELGGSERVRKKGRVLNTRQWKG